MSTGSDIEQAVDILKKAFAEDQEFADTWHDNIAMAMFSGFGPDNELYSYQQHTIANKGASIFMKNAFDVSTIIPSERQ